MLQGPSEKILAIGPYGAGKSYAWLSIALWAQRTGSDAQFYVISTDDATSRATSSQEFGQLRNLHDYPCFVWPDFKQASVEIRSVIRPQDWLIVDLLDPAWEAVQAYFIEQVFNENIEDYFLQARKETKSGKGTMKTLDGWKDWSIINRLYKAWVNPLFLQTKVNIYATAKVEQVSSDTDDKETRLIFGPYGVKPKGQKETGNLFHSILLFNYPKAGKYYLTTIRDRQRPVFEKLPLTNFVTQYLVKVGGWRM